MSELGAWLYGWLDERALPAAVDPQGRVVAAVEMSAEDQAAREIRVGRTAGETPLLTFEVHSADRIAAEHAPQVYAACNRWNAGQRMTRAWVVDLDATLGVAIGAALPLASATPESVRRTGDAAIASARDFWRWADLHADW